jgi:hypothetical protein
MINKEAMENFRLARATMTQDEVACNYCGCIWEPTCEREEKLCPNCRRVPNKDYPNAPLGDVSFARVKQEKARLEAKTKQLAAKPVAKK